MVCKFNLVPNREFYRKKSKFVKGEIIIPLYFFSNKSHTILESLILNLKDKRNLNYHQIGVLINRNERNIRESYLNAKLKPAKYKISSPIFIPISIFSDRKLSALESIVFYLHDKHNLKFSQIAVLLSRDPRTIWTVYQRARKKNAE